MIHVDMPEQSSTMFQSMLSCSCWTCEHLVSALHNVSKQGPSCQATTCSAPRSLSMAAGRAAHVQKPPVDASICVTDTLSVILLRLSFLLNWLYQRFHIALCAIFCC